jgi:hypothetical protein
MPMALVYCPMPKILNKNVKVRTTNKLVKAKRTMRLNIYHTPVGEESTILNGGAPQSDPICNT